MTSTERQARIRSALERYEGPLIRYAVRITGDVDTARDVVQDTFLRLCTAKRSPVDDPPGEDHLAAWLYTTCRNRALDVKRKERPMNPLAEAHLEHQPSPRPSPSDTLEQKETEGRVLRALETLPEKQQEVVRLKFQSGLSYREISRVTGHSVSNVGYLIHMAVKALRATVVEGGL